VILPNDTAPYFVTSTTVNWLPLFSNPTIAKIVFDSLSYLQQNQRIILYAYVLMENHIHLVAAAEDLSKELGNFKSFTARQSIDCYQQAGNSYILEQLAANKLPNKIDRDYQFWQEGFGPKRIHDHTMMEQKINYIHYNPVRRGYVEAPEHWIYSSARNYLGMPGLLEVCMDW